MTPHLKFTYLLLMLVLFSCTKNELPTIIDYPQKLEIPPKIVTSNTCTPKMDLKEHPEFYFSTYSHIGVIEMDPGYLFRAPPVQLSGNIYNDQTQETVLGNFGVIAISEARQEF